MTDTPYPDDHDRLAGNIRTELQAQTAMRDLDLDEATLDALAQAIATNVEYAFELEWAPRWVKHGEPHRWAEQSPVAGELHFVECLQCKRITTHPTAQEADEWWSSHLAGDHA